MYGVIKELTFKQLMLDLSLNLISNPITIRMQNSNEIERYIKILENDYSIPKFITIATIRQNKFYYVYFNDIIIYIRNENNYGSSYAQLPNDTFIEIY